MADSAALTTELLLVNRDKFAADARQAVTDTMQQAQRAANATPVVVPVTTDTAIANALLDDFRKQQEAKAINLNVSGGMGGEGGMRMEHMVGGAIGRAIGAPELAQEVMMGSRLTQMFGVGGAILGGALAIGVAISEIRKRTKEAEEAALAYNQEVARSIRGWDDKAAGMGVNTESGNKWGEEKIKAREGLIKDIEEQQKKIKDISLAETAGVLAEAVWYGGDDPLANTSVGKEIDLLRKKRENYDILNTDVKKWQGEEHDRALQISHRDSALLQSKDSTATQESEREAKINAMKKGLAKEGAEFVENTFKEKTALQEKNADEMRIKSDKFYADELDASRTNQLAADVRAGHVGGRKTREELDVETKLYADHATELLDLKRGQTSAEIALAEKQDADFVKFDTEATEKKRANALASGHELKMSQLGLETDEYKKQRETLVENQRVALKKAEADSDIDTASLKAAQANDLAALDSKIDKEKELAGIQTEKINTGAALAATETIQVARGQDYAAQLTKIAEAQANVNALQKEANAILDPAEKAKKQVAVDAAQTGVSAQRTAMGISESRKVADVEHETRESILRMHGQDIQAAREDVKYKYEGPGGELEKAGVGTALAKALQTQEAQELRALVPHAVGFADSMSTWKAMQNAGAMTPEAKAAAKQESAAQKMLDAAEHWLKGTLVNLWG